MLRLPYVARKVCRHPGAAQNENGIYRGPLSLAFEFCPQWAAGTGAIDCWTLGRPAKPIKTRPFMKTKQLPNRLCLPCAVAVLAFLVTGCPHNEYLVQLQPNGNHIARTLILYSVDGLNTNGSPNYCNGRWDESARKVLWDTSIGDRTKTNALPFTCYASWGQANETFQTEHFGKIALTGDGLIKYCLWRGGQSLQQGGEWDAFLAGLQPGPELAKRLDAFRFSNETPPLGTNGTTYICNHSPCPRDLLKAALQ